VSAPATERPGRLARAAAFLDDPILLKELRASFRKRHFFWLQTGLLLVVALVVIFTMWYYTDDYRRDPSEIGRKTFLLFGSLELGLIVLIFPAFACTSITDERTNKSLDLLLTTNLSPSRIVLGKTLAAFVYGLQFIITTLPLVALTFLYGGVTPGQIVLAYGGMVVLAALITVHALSVSSAAPSTLRAVLSTYVGLVLIVIPIALPLVTTYPVSWAMGTAGNGTLSGVLAVHVYGPLTKTAPLLEARDTVLAFDGFTTALYWAGHALFYASAISLFFLVARHRLAPQASNRSTPLRVWFLLTFGLFLAGTLAALVHLGPGKSANDILIALELAIFFIFVGAAVAFAGEDPLVPRRLRASFDKLRGLKAPIGVLYPGGGNGLRFVIYAALLAYGATFLVFASAVGVGFEPDALYRPPATILTWTTLWGFLFIVFAGELAYLFSCELRHEVASRVCAVIALVAIALGPFLWFVIEQPERRSYAWKGYWASPVTVALSAIAAPTKLEDRQLMVGGPSGFDMREARDAVTRRCDEFKEPPGARPEFTQSVPRTRHELEEKGVEPETIDATCAVIASLVPQIPTEPGAVDENKINTLCNESRTALLHELARRGTPVHEVSTYAYAAIVFVLGFVIRKRAKKLAS
jgi:ABC-type transport system involved in multi-copper enzyme maturation permease subunit